MRLAALTLLFIAVANSTGVAQSAGGRAEFTNPPLQYLGPDPTANQFLPHSVRDVPSAPDSFSPLPPRLATHAYPDPPLPSVDPVLELTSETRSLLDSPLSDHKDGFFQKLSFTGTYIDRGSLESYGLAELDLFAAFALPAPTREWPMLITPAFNVRYLDGPPMPNLPPRLYETYLDFMWLPRVSPRWTGIVSVAPSFYSDFEVDDSEAFRLTGRGLARFDWIPDHLQLVFGLLYLNREDVTLLPAGGIIWIPSEYQRYELIFPRPKVAHRLGHGEGFEDWLYLGGEFGGNSWPVDLDGTTDTITLRDYRILLGLERKLHGGAGCRVEIGYVFGREIEFLSGIPTVHGDDAALVRGGVSY